MSDIRSAARSVAVSQVVAAVLLALVSSVRAPVVGVAGAVGFYFFALVAFVFVVWSGRAELGWPRRFALGASLAGPVGAVAVLVRLHQDRVLGQRLEVLRQRAGRRREHP